MSVNWEDVETEWLLGQSISLDQTEDSGRFQANRGYSWCRVANESKKGRRHCTSNNAGLRLWRQKLSSIDGSKGSNELIGKIKRNEASSHSELTAAYLLKAPGTIIEFGRKWQRIESDDRASGSSRMGSDWAYVEVASPNESELQKKAQQIVGTLATRISELDVEIVLELHPPKRAFRSRNRSPLFGYR